MTIEDLQQGFHYCMHGLGAYSGLRQTNTLEALDYWYKKGVRVFEMDIAKTEDNEYVAVAHTVDGPSMKRMDIIDVPDHYTYDWFMSQRLFPVSTKGLTPISIQMIPSIMDKYKDAIIMFDLFGLFDFNQTDSFCKKFDGLLSNIRNLKNRILVEAYNLMMLDAICRHDFEPIFCARFEHDLNDANDVQQRIARLKDFGVRFISYPWKYKKFFPIEINEYSKAGMTVFSRTKYNTRDKELRAEGVHVNIIAYRFDGYEAPIQALCYFISCLKRLIVKKIVDYRDIKIKR